MKKILVCGVIGAGMMLAATAGEKVWDVSVEAFPRLAGETDDAPRLQRAIDATGAQRVLYVPGGVYEVAKELMVTNASSLLLHKSATIRAIAKMENVVHIDMKNGTMWRWSRLKPGETYDQGLFLKGGHIDGNGLASCLFLQHYFHFTLRDTVFVNGFPYGLHVGRYGAEIIANNLYFRVTKSGLAGNVALFSEGHDSQYSDLVAVDYTVGLRTRGGANSFTKFHVWGGPIPPVAKGRLPEMLEGSVNFDLGGHMNVLRDCYADTGEIGFLVSGWAQQILGCWYYNNPGFHLKKVTIVKQDPKSTNLIIGNGCFRATGPETTLYEGPGNVLWQNMIYGNFPAGTPLPGVAICEPDIDPPPASADAWELIGPGQGRYVSPAGEFVKPNSARALTVQIPRRNIARHFPKAGPGQTFVLRVRATDANTKCLEFSVSQEDGRIWGMSRVPLTQEWKEIRLPFSDLHYFSHYANMPKLEPGERPDARKMTTVRLMYGNWISGGTAAKPHGFEVSSLRIVGR